MNFSGALAECRNGKRITRKGWNAPGQWVAMSPGFTLDSDGIFSAQVREKSREKGYGTFGPYLMLYNAQDTFIPWQPSQGDLLAEDWETA